MKHCPIKKKTSGAGVWQLSKTKNSWIITSVVNVVFESKKHQDNYLSTEVCVFLLKMHALKYLWRNFLIVLIVYNTGLKDYIMNAFTVYGVMVTLKLLSSKHSNSC